MRRALLLLGLLSCKVANESYCDSITMCPSGLSCNGQHVCVEFDAPACIPTTCTGENHVCLDGTCVQCLDASSGDCPAATTPVCDKADAECGQTLCDTELGSCVASDDILHVTPTGSGTSCTAGAPCAKISDAVAVVSSGKHWIQVGTGNYADTVQINTPQPVNIVGVGTVLVIPSTNAPVITVGMGTDVLVRGLRLANGADPSNDGVRCDGDGGTTLRLRQMQIDSNGGTGVNASRCTVTVERSRIFANQRGGLLLFQSGFTVRNNYIFRNGNDVSGTGGAHFIMAVASPRVFEFNTLTRNVAPAGVGPGLHCDAALDINSVIVWGNGVSPAVAQVGGNCVFDYSDIGGTAVKDKHNIKDDPAFLDPATDDYALGPLSPCADSGQPGTGTTEDFQGEPRPNGAAPDIGADERY